MHGALFDLNGKIQLPNFSEPEVNFGSLPTGINQEEIPGIQEEEFAMCAGRIRETGCTLATFEPPRAMNVIIEGDPYICDNNTHEFTAKVDVPGSTLPGQPPYTYKWSWSNDGLFPQNAGTLITQTTEDVDIDASTIGSCSFIFLHVEVTSSDNVKSYASRKLIKYRCAGCDDPVSPVPGPLVVSNEDLLRSHCKLSQVRQSLESCFIQNLTDHTLIVDLYSSSGQLISHWEVPKDGQIQYNRNRASSLSVLRILSKEHGCSESIKLVSQ
jgi:hypothetical protein